MLEKMNLKIGNLYVMTGLSGNWEVVCEYIGDGGSIGNGDNYHFDDLRVNFDTENGTELQTNWTVAKDSITEICTLIHLGSKNKFPEYAL